MWPFKTKQLTNPYGGIDMQLKSLSLPQAQPRWKLFAHKQHDWRPEVGTQEGYNQSAIVYAMIEKRAKLIASVPWKAMRKNGKEWKEVPNSPLQKLVNRPNPDQSFYELMYEASQQLDLSGNGYLSKIKAGSQGFPRHLWLLPSENMAIKPGNGERLIDYFEYQDAGIKTRIMPEDMAQLKMPNPSNRYFGMPVLKAGGRAADIDRESGIWQKCSLENRGAAEYHLKVPEGTTQEQIDAAKKSLHNRNQGPKNARKPLVTSGEIQQLGMTAVELDFVESRKAVWTELAAIFGVPLATLGMTEAVNLANAESMERQLWVNTIIPQLELIQRQLNHQLASDFGDDYKLVYDTSNVKALQTSEDDKLNRAQALFNMGVPFNDINQRLELGYDDIKGGDIGYIGASLIPVGFEVDDDTPEDDDSDVAFGGS